MNHPIYDRATWNEQSHEQQTQAIETLLDQIGPNFKYVDLKTYTCGKHTSANGLTMMNVNLTWAHVPRSAPTFAAMTMVSSEAVGTTTAGISTAPPPGLFAPLVIQAAAHAWSFAPLEHLILEQKLNHENERHRNHHDE